MQVNASQLQKFNMKINK